MNESMLPTPEKKSALPTLLWGMQPSHPEWVNVAAADLAATMADHFHCERKAAASALSLMRLYPHRSELVAGLARLVSEESRHLLDVQRKLEGKNLPLRPDLGDRYAAALRKEVRKLEPGRQLDLLLVFAFIEARSAERLGILANHLTHHLASPLGGFYRRLAEAEVRHAELFFELARPVVPEAEFRARFNEFLAIESTIIAALPLEPRIH